jgi:hypothetical protein
MGALEVIDPLLGIAQRDEPAVMAELGDHPPFFGVGVLKLVDDDQGIATMIAWTCW